MHSTIAWKDQTWAPLSDVQLSLNDWGVLQGVVVVDRLRTCHQRTLDLPQHFARLNQNCEAVGISTSHLQVIPDVIEQCVEKNRNFYHDQDFGLVVLVTPGLVGGQQPTLIVHTQPLNWSALAHWCDVGQELLIATPRNVPAACWSPAIKTRSRLHYYLADQEAAASEHAGAVLLNTDGFMTETSAASLIVVDQAGRICAPPVSDVLGSISLDRTLRLAASAGMTVVRQPLAPQLVESAREILLAGTSGCLWPASSLDDRQFDNAPGLPVYTHLRDRWIEEIALDYVAQSKCFRDAKR